MKSCICFGVALGSSCGSGGSSTPAAPPVPAPAPTAVVVVVPANGLALADAGVAPTAPRPYLPRGETFACSQARPHLLSAAEYRSSCQKGQMSDCLMLTLPSTKADATDVELARRQLKTTCEARQGKPSRAWACACASYGQVRAGLDNDPVGGLILWDESCVAGATDACDYAQLQGDICTHGNLDSPVCRDLAEQRRLGRKR
jgi:hypothetical protein